MSNGELWDDDHFIEMRERAEARRKSVRRWIGLALTAASMGFVMLVAVGVIHV
jgi:hypothetical protein